MEAKAPAMRAKLAEARVAYANCNPMIRGATAHAVVPMLELLDMLVQRVAELEAQAAPCVECDRRGKVYGHGE